VSDEAPLVREPHGAVLVARLDRPEARNALSPTLIRAVGAAIRDAETDADVRAVVLTATGDRAFCSGMDLRAFAAGDSFDLGNDDDSTRAVERMRELQPIVFGSDDAREGAAAFVEKRPPVWRGR
jgi:enoyl-CoA hydratase/carnithine racemase